MRCVAVYDFHGFLLYTDTVLSDVVVVLLSVVRFAPPCDGCGRLAAPLTGAVLKYVDM